MVTGIMSVGFDIRLYTLPKREDLLGVLDTYTRRPLPFMQLWTIDALPVCVSHDGDGRVFVNGCWTEFETRELVSDGTPLSYFLFDSRWRGLVSEQEFLASFRADGADTGEMLGSLDAQVTNVLNAAQFAISWNLPNLDENTRNSFYREFSDKVTAIANEVERERFKLERERRPLAPAWSAKIFKLRVLGPLALFHLQLKFCAEIPSSVPRLRSLVDVAHLLLNDMRNVFNERMRSETDVLPPSVRGEVRTQWNEFTYQTSRKVVAEAATRAKQDEFRLISGFDLLVRPQYLDQVNEGWQKYKRRIRLLRLWTTVRNLLWPYEQ